MLIKNTGRNEFVQIAESSLWGIQIERKNLIRTGLFLICGFVFNLQTVRLKIASRLF
jgi:hypothetical protein